MLQTGLINDAHSDLVTCAVYDFYGTRLATCGLDQKICVWALSTTAIDSSPQWSLQTEWKAHQAPIASLSWAHPQFGDVLASASFDRTVRIWEKVPGEKTYNESALFLDFCGSVRQVEFAPAGYGLRLATVATDGWVRVYECLDWNRLDVWALADALDLERKGVERPSAVTAQGEKDKDGGEEEDRSSVANPPGGSKEADGGWSLSWCKDPYGPSFLAVVVGQCSSVNIIQFSPSRSPNIIFKLDLPPSSPPPNTNRTITSVSWAPSCGRSYHLIATGDREGHVRIWRVDDQGEDTTGDEDGGDTDEDEPGRQSRHSWSAKLVADFDDHANAPGMTDGVVGKVEWNVTGTILSSSGSDGRVRLWKATTTSAGRIWRNAGSVGVEQR
ncbi:WD40 repeat-like protein [Lentinula raphanica]|nr:WD40 repeat-like protein [Lentinula raphanica]